LADLGIDGRVKSEVELEEITCPSINKDKSFSVLSLARCEFLPSLRHKKWD
jgi:hypothetical protein